MLHKRQRWWKWLERGTTQFFLTVAKISIFMTMIAGSKAAGGNLSKLPNLNQCKKLGKNNCDQILFYSINPRSIRIKWQEELANFIWFEMPKVEWMIKSLRNMWQTALFLCSHVLVIFWKNSYHQCWQWPWLSWCGVTYFSLDVMVLSLSRCYKYHDSYTRNRPKSMVISKVCFGKFGIFNIGLTQLQLDTQHPTIFDWIFSFWWNWSNQPGNSPKKCI